MEKIVKEYRQKDDKKITIKKRNNKPQIFQKISYRQAVNISLLCLENINIMIGLYGKIICIWKG